MSTTFSSASAVECCRVEKTNKTLIYVLSVKRPSDKDEILYVGRTYEQFHDFRKGVLEQCAQQNHPSGLSLPDIQKAKAKWFETKKSDEKKRKVISEFCQQVLKLPDEIVNGRTVYEFFSQNPSPTEEGVLNKSDSSCDKQDKRQTTIKEKSDVSRVPSSGAEVGKGPLTEDIVVYEDVSVDTAPGADRFKVVPRTGAYEEIVILDNKPTHQMESCTDSSKTACNEVTDSETTVYASVIKNQDHERRKTSSPPPSPPVIYSNVYSINREPPKHSSGVTAAPELDTSDDCIQEDYCNIDGLHRNGESNRESQSYTEVLSPPPVVLPSPPLPVPRAAVSSKPPNLALRQSQNGTKSGALNSPGPLTPIPPMPQCAPPTLEIGNEELENVTATTGEEGEVQIAAIADYSSTSENIMSFKKGALATLVVQSDTAWWCVRLKKKCGWVPSAYWRTLNSGDCGSLSSKSSSAPWFSGKLSRSECESLLMQHGKQRHFFVRESANVTGRYALSVKYNDRVHHFPIELTADNKYNIGKHDFKSITNVISYYKRYALFYDDNGQGVTLGSPLVVAEEKSVSAATTTS